MGKASDNVYPKILTAMQTSAPSAPADSSWKIYAKAGGIFARSSNAEVGPFGGASSSITYSDWTPVLTAASVNPTMGSGAGADGRYFQSGKNVVGHGFVEFGSSGVAAGTGAYRFSLPVNANTTDLTYSILGSATLYDSSTGTLSIGICTRVSTSTCQIFQHSNTSPVAATSPWTWAAGDIIQVSLNYEAA